MTTMTSPQTSPARVARTTLRLLAPTAVVGSTLLAAPALADVPEGWAVPEEPSLLDFLLLLVLIPLGLGLLIALAVYLPALVRGEKVAPNAAPIDDQWFGGPRSGKGELASPAERDVDGTKTGGASGSW